MEMVHRPGVPDRMMMLRRYRRICCRSGYAVAAVGGQSAPSTRVWTGHPHTVATARVVLCPNRPGEHKGGGNCHAVEKTLHVNSYFCRFGFRQHWRGGGRGPNPP